MKLAHYQIEHIKEYLALQNIWHDDIKAELLDHIICAVEEEMTANNKSFIDALAIILIDIKPNELQKQKLNSEHLRTYKEVAQELKLMLNGRKLIYLFISLIISSALVLFSGEYLQSNIELYTIGLTILLFFKFVVWELINRNPNPLYNSYFVSRLSAVFLPAFLLSISIGLIFSSLLSNHPFWAVCYLFVFSTLMLASYLVVNKTYIKIKNYAHR